MRSSYRQIGDFIQQLKLRNDNGQINRLLGINLDKKFMPSVANLNGVDLSKYKVIKKGQFGCKLMSVGRDKKVPISRLLDYDEAIISSAYFVFEVINENELNPEYLMMWLSRSESDRFQWFQSGGDIRGRITWEEFCSLPIRVPSIDKQREIVKEYNTIINLITINKQLNQKLEETAQALYKHWFVDFEFPNKNGKPYKFSGGKMVYNEELDLEVPEGWDTKKLEEISALKYGKMLSPSKFLVKGYPIYSGYGIRGYYSKYMYENPEILVLCRGVSGTGEVRMSPAKAYITNLSIVVDITDLEMNKHFLFYFLKNQNLRSLDSGSAQSQITIGDLNKVIILNPNYSIQTIFGQYIQNVKEHLIIKENEIKALISMKDLLLSRMALKEYNQFEQVL